MSKKFVYVNSQGYETEAESYESSDFTSTGGVGKEGKPVILNESGVFDSSLINQSGIDHGNLAGLSDDDHEQYLLIDGTRAMTGDLNLGSNEAFSSAIPSSADSLVNKAYVDAVGVGNRMKGNVAVATTENLTALSGLLLIDGYQTVAGDRVLVKDQTDKKLNGVYVVASGAWSRSADLDNNPQAEILNGVLIPRVVNSASGQATKSWYISSIGTGTDGMHVIGTDNIVFDIYTTPTQLVEGHGIEIDGFNVNIDLAASESGLKFDASDDLAIDFSTSYNDAKAIKASDLSSNSTGKGASIIGIEDAGGFTSETDVEGAIQELYGLIEANGVEYTVGVGGVTKGDLLKIISNDTVTPYGVLSEAHRGLGLALTTETVGSKVKCLANDTVLTNVLSGAVAGTVYYWDGNDLVSTMPSGSGDHVWMVGVAKNATDLSVEVRFIKKNA